MVEDVADGLDDLICAWDKVVGTDVETAVVLLLGWLVFGGVIFLISHLIYSTLGTEEVEDAAYSPSAHIPPFQGSESPSSPPSLVPALSLSPPSHPSHPVAVGSDQDCVTFVNTCLEYVYTRAEVREDMLKQWRIKLSEFARRSALEGDLSLEFVSYLECSSSPSLTNLTVDSLPSDNMALTGDLATTFSFLLRTNHQVGDSLVTMDYVMNIDRIRARLSITFITAEYLVIVKFEGWPNIKMRLSPAGTVPPCLSKRSESLCSAVGDVAAQAIRGVQLDIKTDAIKNFPVFKRTVFPNNAQKKSQLSSTSFGKGGSRPHSAEVNGIGNHSKARHMEVKVVKATQLGGLHGRCVEPYVVLEVDEPGQRHQTSAGAGAVCGWDDIFKIDITKQSSELLFEVWDQGQKVGQSDAFMGLAIVSVSELMVTASQRHVLPLQGRPYQEDQVTGLLTIEFLFKDVGLSWEDKDLLPGVYRSFESKENQNLAGRSVVNKKTVYSRQASQVPEGDQTDPCTDHRQSDSTSLTRRESYLRATRFNKTDLLTGSSVPAMALKDISINKTRKGPKEPTKSTLIMHSVQTIASSPSGQSGNDENGDSTTTTDYTDDASDSIGEASITSKDSALNKYQRGRRPKRNLISTIKKRFTGTRSLSSTGMDNPEQASYSRETLQTPGVGKVRSVSEHRVEEVGHDGVTEYEEYDSHSTDTDSGCSLTLPSWRGSLSLSWQSDLHLSAPNHEDGSSMSDVSGISMASTKTYVSEDSSLVLETLENGRHHHYLIPTQAARRGKFKKAGTKLHIYMDHIFTAQHIKLGTRCDTCSRLIPLRLGKQAYVCRDCGVTTHKQCHTKVETHCRQTSLPSMELEFYSEN